MKGMKLEYKNVRSHTLAIHSPKIIRVHGTLYAKSTKFFVLHIILFEKVFESKKFRIE
jgi:hypothetical protein